MGCSMNEALDRSGPGSRPFSTLISMGKSAPLAQNPGSDMIKPNVDNRKESFSKHNQASKWMASFSSWLLLVPLPGYPVLTKEG